MNDGVLVEALRARDPGALAALYDTYAENLYRYCRTLLAGPDAAQVALRDTLIAAEALIGSLADPDRFRAWLYALARGECLRRRTPGEEDGPESGPAPLTTVPFPGVSADGPEADLRLVASSAVGALSVDDREVLELVTRHAMTGRDLAAVLGAGERYAEGLLEAATERLREMVTVELLARRTTHDCERASAILAGFTGELTPQLRAQLLRHLARCETCARHRVRQVSPAKVFGLLPQVALPETLRVRVLSSFIDPELVPYRRYVAKRVGPLNAAGFPRAGRREGRLAQAVAGTVAALAAVATIALVFAQFAGDLRERTTDTIALRRPPTAAAPSGSPTGTASPEESGDEAGERSPAPPASRDLAEPVAPAPPAEPVALPRPMPLPAPAPPSVVRPRHPAPPARPSAHPTDVPSVPPRGTSPSGPTPMPPSAPGTGQGEEPGPGGPGSGSPGSGGPGSGGPGSGGPGGPGSGWPPHGGPPPAHWPGHRPPWRDHQHHPRPRPECPPTPEPSHTPPRDHDRSPAVPPWRGGHGGRHAVAVPGPAGGPPRPARPGGPERAGHHGPGRSAGHGTGHDKSLPGGRVPVPGGSRRDGLPGSGRTGRDDFAPDVRGGTRAGGPAFRGVA